MYISQFLSLSILMTTTLFIFQKTTKNLSCRDISIERDLLNSLSKTVDHQVQVNPLNKLKKITCLHHKKVLKKMILKGKL